MCWLLQRYLLLLLFQVAALPKDGNVEIEAIALIGRPTRHFTMQSWARDITDALEVYQ